MIDPQKHVEALLLNAPSENAPHVAGLMIWMAEQEPGLKTNGEYLKALGKAQSILEYDRQARERDCEQPYQAESCCQSSTANN